MSKIIKVERYQTTDNKLFEFMKDAEKHQNLVDKKMKIIGLLGGFNSDISDDSSFSNGGGFYYINKENYQKAEALIKKLQE